MKTEAGFGYFLRYPSAGLLLVIHRFLIIYKRVGWLWGGKFHAT